MKHMPDKVWVRPGHHVQFSFTADPLPGSPVLIVTGPAWVEKRDGGFWIRQGEPPAGGKFEGYLS